MPSAYTYSARTATAAAAKTPRPTSAALLGAWVGAAVVAVVVVAMLAVVGITVEVVFWALAEVPASRIATRTAPTETTLENCIVVYRRLNT